jgi:hypothetical protein
MRWRLHQTVRSRAAIGLLALYALLLQAFLGYATPAEAILGTGAVICAEHPADASGGGTVNKHIHPCCTVVQAGALALPSLEPAASAWPSAPMVRLAWRPEAELPKTGPPQRGGTARGPPEA